MAARTRILGIIETLLLLFLLLGTLLVDVGGIAALLNAAPSAADPGSVTASYAIGIVLLLIGVPLTVLVLQALGYHLRHRGDEAAPAGPAAAKHAGPPWARDWRP